MASKKIHRRRPVRQDHRTSWQRDYALVLSLLASNARASVKFRAKHGVTVTEMDVSVHKAPKHRARGPLRTRPKMFIPVDRGPAGNARIMRTQADWLNVYGSPNPKVEVWGQTTHEATGTNAEDAAAAAEALKRQEEAGNVWRAPEHLAAYKVVCDETNNSPDDKAKGDLNVDVFIPLTGPLAWAAEPRTETVNPPETALPDLKPGEHHIKQTLRENGDLEIDMYVAPLEPLQREFVGLPATAWNAPEHVVRRAEMLVDLSESLGLPLSESPDEQLEGVIARERIIRAMPPGEKRDSLMDLLPPTDSGDNDASNQQVPPRE